MLCEKCKQREATVHKQAIINGVSHTEHLCSECAAKEGHSWGNNFGSFFNNDFFADDFFGAPSLSNWFEPFFKLGGESSIQKQKQTLDACPKCGTSWEDFQRNGLLGCSECYNHFADALPPLLSQLHSGSEHLGKKPYDSAAVKEDVPKQEVQEEKPMSEVDKLRAQMQQAIEEENFEEACKLRDAIKALEAGEDHNADNQ